MPLIARGPVRFAVGVAFAIAWLLASARADATTVVPVSDANLIRGASAVVLGTVAGATSRWDARHRQVFTEVTLSVDRVLKGSVGTRSITVRQPGGRLGGIEVSVEGAPEFEVGETVLVFLRQRADGSFGVIHLYQGKFSVMTSRSTGQQWAVRIPVAGVRVIGGDADAAADARGDVRKLDDFERAIMSMASGGAAANGLASTNSAASSTIEPSTSSFTFLGAPSRWFDPDDGAPVTIRINSTGSSFAPTLGFSQIRDAMAAWNAVTGSSFRFRDGGFTTTAGWAMDGQNTVTFGDPLGQIDPPVGCSGTLALTVFFRDLAQTRTVNGQSFFRITEADVVFADGWEACGFYQVYANVAEVATHEFGHVLGLGHSSDPSATMYAFAHFDGRGATVTPDDAAGAVFAYPTAPLTLSFTAPVTGATVSGTTPVALAASGGTGLVYRVSVDGTTVYTGTAPGFSWNTTAVANGAHTLVATLTDWLGRATSASVRVTVSNASATGFTAAITYPASGAVVKGNQSVGMSTTAAWGKPKTFTLSVDGNVLTTATVTGTTLWYTWDTTKVASGSRTLTLAVAFNGVTATATRTVTVANATPAPPPTPLPLTATFTSPAASATISGTTTIGMSSAGGASGSRTFKLQFTGPSPVAPVSLTVTGTTATFAWNTTTATNGTYTLTLVVIDAAGASATATRTVTVANTAPTASFTVAISYPAPGATVAANQTIGMSTTARWGTTKTFALAVDGRVVTTQTITGTTLWYTWDTTTVPNGSHQLTLTVTTGTGPTAESSITVTVKN